MGCPGRPRPHWVEEHGPDQRGVYCAGTKFLLLWFLSGTVDQKEDPHSAQPLQAYDLGLPPDVVEQIDTMVSNWNNNCLTWVIP